MSPNTRAMVAAAAFAFITGRKVAGVYDHSEGRDRRIAAECRGDRLQGFDGDRSEKFGGTLPELYLAAGKTFISMEIEGTRARGYDRASSGFYEAQAVDGLVQVYDHGEGAWFSYDMQDAELAQGYYRKDEAMKI